MLTLPNTVRVTFLVYGSYTDVSLVQAVGHADLFQDAGGQWWGVALAVRSGPEWVTFPLGRETVLYNATWEYGAWPELQHPVRGEMQGWSLPDIAQSVPGDG
jgi:beta-xylosidase